jgi:hypothetical protein
MCRRGALETGCIAAALLVTAAAWDDVEKLMNPSELETSSAVIKRLVVPVETLRNPQTELELSSFGVARRGTATIEDAYRQFLSLAASHQRVVLATDVDEMSFDEVTARLETLCIVDSDWSYSANTCLRRDVLAYMTCRYLGCRPGLLTSVFGMTRRYAHREMLYQKVIAPGAPATLVSGSELLSVATRVSRRVEPRRDVQLTSDEIH